MTNMPPPASSTAGIAAPPPLPLAPGLRHAPPLRYAVLLGMLLATFLIVWLAPPHHALEGVAHYAWLHTALETGTTVVACMVFGVAWNAYSAERPGNILLLALGLLASGLVGTLHLLSYAGMPDFITPSGAEKAINFWLAERLLFALTLVGAGLRNWAPVAHPPLRYAGLAGTLGLVALLAWIGLFHQDWLPRTFVPGEGLTAFKVGAEFTVIGLLMLAAVLFVRRPLDARGPARWGLFAAAVVSVLGELCFTLYSDVTDVFNLLGHLYQGVANVLIYRAVFVGSVQEPFERMRQAEERMRAASLHARALLEAALDPAATIDADGRITDLNRATEQLTGRDRTELLGTEFASHFTAPEHARAAIATTLTEGMVREVPLQVRHAAGSTTEVHFNIALYRRADGAVAGLFATGRDMSRIRHAEQMLEHQHALLTKITETSPAGITVWNTAGHIIYANAEAERILRRDRRALRQLRFDDATWQFTDPFGVPLPAAELPVRRVLDARAPVHGIQLALAAPDGQRVHLSINAAPLAGAQGETQGVIATLEDITARREVETMLQTSEERLKLAMSAASMGAWVLDLQRNEYVLSAELSHLLGMQGDQARIGRAAFLQLVHPDDRANVQDHIRQTLANDSGGWVDFRITLADGQLRWFSAQARAVRGPQGQPHRLVGMAIDISLRKQDEAVLSRANRALRSLSGVNELLIHATDEQSLLEQVCRVLVEAGGYRLAWIAEPVDDAARSVVPLARYGDTDGFLNQAAITWADTAMGQGPTGLAVRTGLTHVDQDVGANPHAAPWRAALLAHGWLAGISLPFDKRGEAYRTLTIMAGEADAFHPDEVKFLHDLVEDLKFGIDALRLRAERNRMADEEARHESQLRQSLIDSIQSIAALAEMRDPYTAGHQRRVAQLAVAIARELQLAPDRIEGLQLAALIHDVGKIQVPAEILNRPGRLNPIELALIKLHPQAGYDILKDIRFPWPIARIVVEHHERIDGSGYPAGLAGEQILLESRILTVADVVEAMTSHRPYRPGLGLDAALAEIARHRGTWYDAAACDACLALFHEGRFRYGEPEAATPQPTPAPLTVQ